MIFIGVDPGKKGGMALVKDNGEVYVSGFSLDNYLDMIETHCHEDDVLCYVEQVHSMPNQGVKSTFTFGENYGLIQGILFCNRIRYDFISPQKWKKYFKLDQNKQHSINLAKKIFPDTPLRNSTRCRTDSDGIAEALLIARYLQEEYNRNKEYEERKMPF